MIDWERTEQETGFGKVYFERYPGSGRKVFAVCDECGVGRQIKYNSYHDLCRKCVQTLDLPIDQIINEYENGINPYEIGEKYGCDGGTIINRLKQVGIKLRLSPAKSLDSLIDQIIIEYKNGISVIKLGEKYDCSGTTISKKLKQAGIELRSNGELQTISLPIDQIINEYENGMSTIELGEKYNCDNSTISNRLRENGIEIGIWTEEARKRFSALQQGIPYEKWPGFTDKSRPHLTPIHACIQLNQRFPGSEGHHIMSSVVIFVPRILHQSNYHNFKTGVGMDEINKLAFNFLISTQW